jgi:hypothetical protein
MIVGRVNVIINKLEKLVCWRGRGELTRKHFCQTTVDCKHTGFFLLQLGKSSHKAGVYIQRFKAGDWMRAHGWMMRVDRGTVGSDSPEVNDGVV